MRNIFNYVSYFHEERKYHFVKIIPQLQNTEISHGAKPFQNNIKSRMK